MGKLHRIRRLLRNPEQREKIINFTRGVWIKRHTAPHVYYGSAHQAYVKKVLRDYLSQ